MTTVIGGVVESKDIGLSIDLTGTHDNTEYDAVSGRLRLKTVDVDGGGNNLYADEGVWTSSVINLGDKFKDFDKLFTTHVDSGSSAIAKIETRVSDNSREWSDWVQIASDGTIMSDTKQYIQVRIALYAGFVNDVFIVDKSEYTENNEYVENKIIKEGAYAVPTLTFNTSSSEGFAFAKSAYSTTYPAYRAFDKNTASGGYQSATVDIPNGFVGFYFNNPRRISKYKMIASTTATSAPKSFYLEASNDTTTGLDGTWVILDTQVNISWTALQVREFSVKNINKYRAYRIRWISNNGHSNSTALMELDFYEEEKTNLKLKRNYEYDMTLDTTWTEEGSLHRKLIERDDWTRIDKMNVLIKE